jgi:hypothetical protein
MPEAYQVLGLRKRVQLDPLGHLIDVYQIEFKTAKGAVSSIRVPVEGFTPELAKRELDKQAKALDALFS